MKLLPSERTEKQLAALRKFIDKGEITLNEPCNCGEQIKHNNGGNYHDIISIKADGGDYFIRNSTTYEYDNSQWSNVDFVYALNKIQEYAALGYYF